MKKILITGATSGFGKAAAERFAKEGNEIIITGRREERLQDLKKELSEKYGITVHALAFDVQDKEAVFEALSTNPLIDDLDVLVNNAGLALGRDLFDEANLDDWETMIDTNVKGLLYVCEPLGVS